jgi:hypothetical protein
MVIKCETFSLYPVQNKRANGLGSNWTGYVQKLTWRNWQLSRKKPKVWTARFLGGYLTFSKIGEPKLYIVIGYYQIIGKGSIQIYKRMLKKF